MSDDDNSLKQWPSCAWVHVCMHSEERKESYVFSSRQALTIATWFWVGCGHFPRKCPGRPIGCLLGIFLRHGCKPCARPIGKKPNYAHMDLQYGFLKAFSTKSRFYKYYISFFIWHLDPFENKTDISQKRKCVKEGHTTNNTNLQVASGFEFWNHGFWTHKCVSGQNYNKQDRTNRNIC